MQKFFFISYFAFFFLINSLSAQIERIVNGDFEDGLDPWKLFLFTDTTASMDLETTTPISGSASAHINITNNAGQSWFIQFCQLISVAQYETYIITYKARASESTTMDMMIQESYDPWYIMTLRTDTLTTEVQTYTDTFTVDRDIDNVYFALMFGISGNVEIWVDDISIMYFSTINIPPNIPALTIPEYGAVINDTTFTLVWYVPIDRNDDSLHFVLEINDDDSFGIGTLLFESMNDTSGFHPTPPIPQGQGTAGYTLQSEIAEGDWWWRVTAWDGQEYGNTSSSRKFTIDTSPPYTSDHHPAADEINVPLTTDIVVHIQDSISGVDSSGIIMKINDETVIPDITGTTSDYTLTYDPPTDFEYGQEVTVSINAEDNAGNSMETETWSFHTESVNVVSTPIVPAGLSDAGVGESITFSSGGSTSDLGDDLDYRFDFGDGIISAWGDSIQSHIYFSVGTFIVKAQARSKIDTTVISNWSSGQTITLSGHQLTLTVNGSGSVVTDPEKSEYNHDEKVILTAIPANNYQFEHWEGSLSGSNNPDSLIMDSDITITAVFTELAERISILPNPFTPNNDGYNDYVSFKYPDMDIKRPIVRIFNLRGRKVKELNSFSGNENRWYGKDEDDRQLEPGVYLYILEVDNKMISSGTITLVR